MNNKLYHSDIYLGKDYTNGIKHWKYIKREKINGKWVYYYSDKELQKAENSYKKAANNYEKAKDEFGGRYDVSTDSKLKESQARFAKNKKQVEKTKKKKTEAAKKYYKVKIKSLPRRTIAKGTSYILNLINK